MFRVHVHVFDIRVSQMRRMKQRFPHMVSTHQIRQSARRSIEVILGKGQFECQLWFPGRTPLDYRETAGTHRNREPADGHSLLAARARLNAVTQWHRRWEYPWVKMVKLLALVGMKT